ncbi:uncharacterized protein BJ171DRAFT_424092 [Polychytrium aggregatum]|uniref:uncharacterized protein n=1 Tax=Polychytrium aggregatum TaxID=110093 RepID=UPI0022FE54BC|nr:uncharacterized protein BJ171DRAFT_424092 [Polychytrium aggregatum]KAI9204548.1 hypothetical protein BJ171DRAFT_424092 [Polychytrium aggregatum]
MAFQTAESIRSSFARQSKQHRKALKHPLLARRIQFKKSTLTQFRSSESSTTTRSSEPTIEESDQPPPPPVPPQNRLFPPSALSFEWDSIFPIGPGLNNLGNTCFLNSVLQCLTYTAPLANYLMTGHHMKTCKNTAFCLLCILENHIQTCFGGKPKSVVSPNAIVKRLKSVAKHMRVGRQEDAHEFLRYFIDGIQKSSLLDNRLKETTLVYQIFGGHILSQVECLSCHYKSNTYDLILDLSLEIKHCDTLEKAFSHYSKPERLYKSNQYKCARCKKYVDAQKRLTIHDPPPVLTVQLKRFDFLRSGMKINKPIAFDEYLDLKPYMTVGQSTPSRYELYAVLVHAGGSCNSGHYYSFVRSSANTWYSMNDSEVRQVSVGTVLKQSAYILFYRLIQSPSNTKKEVRAWLGCERYAIWPGIRRDCN